MKKSTMRILYDDQGFTEPHGGVSRYFTEIMRNLPDGYKWMLPMLSTSNTYLHEQPFELPFHKMSLSDFVRTWCCGKSFSGVSHVYRLCACLFPSVFPSGELANRKAIQLALQRGTFDVFHITGPHWVNDDWKMVAGKKPIVITVHDLIPELIYHDRRVARCRSRLLAAAAHVIAVSENTKKDLIRLYHVPESKITVIYHGYLMGDASVQKSLMGLLPFKERRYLLYVGKRSLYKNFAWFMQSIAPLLRMGIGVVCTGARFSEREKSLLARLGVTEHVCQKFFSDDELAVVFSHALAFVYPSRYEGFGIPILDAFANQCPTIVARSSCFPEVAGNAALYFDLDDSAGLRSQIERLLADESGELRGRLINRGCSRVKDFSWRRCAEETALVYRRVCIV